MGEGAAPFRPRMESRTRGIAARAELRWRAWPGVVADLWQVRCEADAQGEYVSPDPRLFVMLAKTGSGAVRIGPAGRLEQLSADRPLAFVPAGARVRCALGGVKTLDHLDVHFELSAWMDRVGGNGLDGFARPRLAFGNERIVPLARLLAQECTKRHCVAAERLYGDALCLALVCALLDDDPSPERRGLSRQQLGRATAYLRAHLSRHVGIAELAAQTGLSVAHFARSFKVSTGLPPHQWHVRHRLETARALLADANRSLGDIADATGFVDQSHMTRSFRRHFGVTPMGCRMDMLR